MGDHPLLKFGHVRGYAQPVQDIMGVAGGNYNPFWHQFGRLA